ncbi:HEPN domain-containing protein [Lysobacter enzymogenes]|uniref:Apea-like HEPN domain-containing protein n=3 Tax=Bacteria TaxID=2 RepID=A0AAU9API3_LYSEN|nr:HEPN domain-containing protein [Lysobacter enzymogenes]EDN84174.1 hypothetical protein BIFADO_00024 [Bifidobacterium adolescentis L2-32]BAV96296.1 conserved hypothetical protein [Lysobacter enzymogenes]
MDVPGRLTKKEMRTVDRIVSELFTTKAYLRAGDLKGAGKYLERELICNRKPVAYLSDLGLDQLSRLIALLDSADLFMGRANYGDVYSSCRRLLGQCIFDGSMPESGGEFIELLARSVSSRIDDYFFAFPIHGVEVKDLDRFWLGEAYVVPNVRKYIEEMKVEWAGDRLDQVMSALDGYCWLVGKAHGTEAVAQQKFKKLAEIIAGFLAVIAGSRYEWGAESFRIGVITSVESAYGRSAGLRWRAADKSLVTSWQMPKAQLLELNEELLHELAHLRVLPHFAGLCAKQIVNDLESAVLAALYWYSDAHRDTNPVMKFVKYWSCIEAFFSIDGEVTKSVSIGLASVLGFGGHELDYSKTKKRALKLYELRSSAIHSGRHDHISSSDVGLLSQWSAWAILEVLLFLRMGGESLSELRGVVTEVDQSQSKPVRVVRSAAVS